MKSFKISTILIPCAFILLIFSCQKEQTLSTELENTNMKNLQTQPLSSKQISASSKIGEFEL